MQKIKCLLYSVLAFLLFSCQGDNKRIVNDQIEKEAVPFHLSNLRLLDGSPFKHAMDKNGEWLLALEPDRLLHRFYLNAGFEPKGEIYGGWETLGVSGHTLGHYLSACSMMYASSGDKRFKERVDYIVKELARCQDARKTGYVGGIPDEDKLWEDVSKGNITYDGFNLNGHWVPWYTQHKVWAGLIDAYLYAGSEQAKEVVTRLSDWTVHMFSGLSDEKFQDMLTSEFGGMNESLAEVYAITGNKAYLQLAERFYHKAIFDPLKEGRDELEGKHANTQIPKIIGVSRLYELTAKDDYHRIATFFWDRMVNHHTYLNGGNSNHEHLGPPDQLNDRLSAHTSETCNTYNMLKLTKHLFSWDAQAAYFDFYERALYNHIL
ncbi:MAG: glycoside hydrolase family 127 protein, partial [Parabacteroides sp.]|nr:glycoside hydrolase family 127 protein [Parabacteroides sp.]